MDFQFWLYVIIGVIYFLSRVLKKQVPPPGKEGDGKVTERVPEQRNTQSTGPKPMTFEDLLREITEAKQAHRPAYEPESRTETVIDYDDDIADEEQDLETIAPEYTTDDTRSNEVYEEARRQAFMRPSLEETMNVRDTEVSFGKFKGFEQEQQRNLLEEYTKDFQDPEGLKKAIVMSEILNRKF